jgi:hypothetical protein
MDDQYVQQKIILKWISRQIGCGDETWTEVAKSRAQWLQCGDDDDDGPSSLNYTCSVIPFTICNALRNHEKCLGVSRCRKVVELYEN